MKVKQLVAILAIATAALSTGCRQEQNAPTKATTTAAPVAVHTAKVEKQAVANQVELVGTIQAVERAEISAKITGNIINLPLEVGDRVTSGQLLVELSAQEISAQMQQAKAQLEQARRNLAREENLAKRNAATPETVKAFEDSLRIAEAGYRTSMAMLDFTKITAPFSGIVSRKLASVGDLATPGKPLLHLEEENNLQVVTDIPEAMIAKISKGHTLQVTIPSVQQTLSATVAEVSPVADPSSRTSPIKLRLAPNPQLRSGQFVRVTLALADAETLTVPSEAVGVIGQIEKVYVVENGMLALRLVRTGGRDNGHTEILSGLHEGEEVVVPATPNLRDGQAVTVQ
jgi:RND family efflux transporter MFP subunit